MASPPRSLRPPRAPQRRPSAAARVAAIEAAAGGRLGVAVLDAAGERRLAHRADERFAMCWTFKALAAAAALKRVDAGADALDRRIAYGPGRLLEYAPVAKAHVAEGAMTLATSAPRRSNGATTLPPILLLKTIGGPAGRHRTWRARSAIRSDAPRPRRADP